MKRRVFAQFANSSKGKVSRELATLQFFSVFGVLSQLPLGCFLWIVFRVKRQNLW